MKSGIQTNSFVKANTGPPCSQLPRQLWARCQVARAMLDSHDPITSQSSCWCFSKLVAQTKHPSNKKKTLLKVEPVRKIEMFRWVKYWMKPLYHSHTCVSMSTFGDTHTLFGLKHQTGKRLKNFVGSPLAHVRISLSEKRNVVFRHNATLPTYNSHNPLLIHGLHLSDNVTNLRQKDKEREGCVKTGFSWQWERKGLKMGRLWLTALLQGEILSITKHNTGQLIKEMYYPQTKSSPILIQYTHTHLLSVSAHPHSLLRSQTEPWPRP